MSSAASSSVVSKAFVIPTEGLTFGLAGAALNLYSSSVSPTASSAEATIICGLGEEMMCTLVDGRCLGHVGSSAGHLSTCSVRASA